MTYIISGYRLMASRGFVFLCQEEILSFSDEPYSYSRV